MRFSFGELRFDYNTPAGFDRTRNAVIGNPDFDLTYLEEAFTSEHWLVRIYRCTSFQVNSQFSNHTYQLIFLLQGEEARRVQPPAHSVQREENQEEKLKGNRKEGNRYLNVVINGKLIFFLWLSNTSMDIVR